MCVFLSLYLLTYRPLVAELSMEALRYTAMNAYKLAQIAE